MMPKNISGKRGAGRQKQMMLDGLKNMAWGIARTQLCGELWLLRPSANIHDDDDTTINDANDDNDDDDEWVS